MMRRLLLGLIRGYQLLFSSFFGRSCRFYPTCSTYARDSITRFGALRGTALALWRIGRCQPFHPGGYDPVPESFPDPLKRVKNCCKTGSDSAPVCATHHSHPPLPPRPGQPADPGADQ